MTCVSQENKDKEGTVMVIVAPLVPIHFVLFIPFLSLKLVPIKFCVWPSI